MNKHLLRLAAPYLLKGINCAMNYTVMELIPKLTKLKNERNGDGRKTDEEKMGPTVTVEEN